MHPSPTLFLTGLVLLVSPACRTKTNLPDDVKMDMPAEETPSPARKPNTAPDPAASGTRSDYKPTTGPSGQQETNPAAPPSGTNPSPSNPNTPPPPPPRK